MRERQRPGAESPAPDASASAAPPLGAPEVEAWLIRYLAAHLEIDPAKLSPAARFDRLGLDSMDAIVMSEDLERWLGCPVDPTSSYEYPTIGALAAHLAEDARTRS